MASAGRCVAEVHRMMMTRRKTTDPQSQRESLCTELRLLEEQLADAWWHEAPLECIEALEREINQRRASLDLPQAQSDTEAA